MVEGPNTMYSVSRRTVRTHREDEKSYCNIWVVVKIKVPFGVPITIRHLLFRVPKKTLILTTTHMLSSKLQLCRT